MTRQLDLLQESGATPGTDHRTLRERWDATYRKVADRWTVHLAETDAAGRRPGHLGGELNQALIREINLAILAGDEQRYEAAAGRWRRLWLAAMGEAR